jgi:hypothetical protein
LGTARRTGSFTAAAARKRDRSRKWVYLLDESLLLSSDVLCEVHSSELGKGIGLRVVESSKDRLPLWDRESDNPRLALPSLLEPRGQIRFPGASEQTSQLEDVGVRDRDAGELHAHRATRAESRETQPGGSATSTLTSLHKDAGSTYRFAKASGPGRPCRRPFPSPGRRAGWPARQYWRPSRSRERAPPHRRRPRGAPGALDVNRARLVRGGSASRLQARPRRSLPRVRGARLARGSAQRAGDARRSVTHT